MLLQRFFVAIFLVFTSAILPFDAFAANAEVKPKDAFQFTPQKRDERFEKVGKHEISMVFDRVKFSASNSVLSSAVTKYIEASNHEIEENFVLQCNAVSEKTVCELDSNIFSYYNKTRQALSIVMYTYIYTDGDHGYYKIDNKIFDVLSGKEVPPGAVIAGYQTSIIDKINHYIEENELTLEPVTPELFKDAHIFYGQNGITVAFDAGKIGDFASGTPIFEFGKRLNIVLYKTQMIAD